MATVLLLILWAVSGWWAAGWVGPSWYVGLSPGLVYISFADFKAIVTGEGFCHAPVAMGAHWEWLPEFYNGPVELAMLIPIWMLALATLCISIIAWRMEINACRLLNPCHACGYDRTGLASGVVCPECGTLGKS